MTCTARSISGYGGFSGLPGRGSSESARHLEDKLRRVNDGRDITALVQLSKYRTLAQVDEVVASCSQLNWGGNDELPITLAAVCEARQLIDMLPVQFAGAEVSPEPWGSIALEWRFAPMHTIVISVTGRGVLEYAGVAGRNSEFHGRVAFAGELPELLLRYLTATRDARDA